MARAGVDSELTSVASDLLVPAAPDRRVRRAFAWYAERLLRKRFHAVRAMAGSEPALAALASQPAPSLLVLSHSSWWDPIIASVLWRRWFGSREVFAPMDARELARFRFMRKLGIFGIDPEDARSLAAMQDYLGSVLREVPNAVLVLTPQGRFSDPREPLAVRPGAAALAAHFGVRSAVAVAVEYAFWNDRKPEVFLRAAPIAVPTVPSTSNWQRAIVDAMTENAELLATGVRSRDPAGFAAFLGGKATIHPVYDLWLRLTGRGRAIDVRHRHAMAGDVR